jgi:hypothetical protein
VNGAVAPTRCWRGRHPGGRRADGPVAKRVRPDFNREIPAGCGRRRLWRNHGVSARCRVLSQLDGLIGYIERPSPRRRIRIFGDSECDGTLTLPLLALGNRDPRDCAARRPRTLTCDGDSDSPCAACGPKIRGRHSKRCLTTDGRSGRGDTCFGGASTSSRQKSRRRDDRSKR